jgi:quercetin dioxygenase-like cupin family protein
MRRRLICLGLFSATIAATALYPPGSALATTPEGYKSTLLAVGRFGEIDVSSSFPHGLKAEGNEQLWRSLQETKGLSDVYVQSNVWAPGGSTGWHTHPGHSLIIVTAGSLTEYHADCMPHVYHAGDTFVDPGEGEEHIIRNESSTEPAANVAVQLVPHDPLKMNRRIDVPQPETCPNIN